MKPYRLHLQAQPRPARLSPPPSSADEEPRRYPRAEAIVVARELVRALEPVCERLLVAGSLRRRKPIVKDVEIVFVPRREPRAENLFDVVDFNLAEEAIAKLLAAGTLAKRPSVTGSFAWGPKNKLARHRSGMPVDLFAATEANWWNYVVCRTGPAESNTLIAARAQQWGYKWNPYGEGFTRLSDGETIPMGSERAVFEFVGLPYPEPCERV